MASLPTVSRWEANSTRWRTGPDGASRSTHVVAPRRHRLKVDIQSAPRAGGGQKFTDSAAPPRGRLRPAETPD